MRLFEKKWLLKKVFSVVLLILALLVGWRFWQSEGLKKQADLLVKTGDPEDALDYYEQASKTFPMRSDIADDLNAIRLILASNIQYGQVYEIGAQIQELPPQTFNHPPLKAGELFVPILMYHHIRINPRPSDPVWAALNVSQDQLDTHLQYLASHNYHTIDLDELYRALNGKSQLPENPIILTFDDGYRNFYENAFPLLKKYNMRAVQFVITAVVDSSPYLTWQQISEMDASGLVQFGAHTRHHPNLPELSQKAIVDEIVGSKNDLETHLHKKINWFCYPYGSYNDFIVQTVKNDGFLGAASTIYGPVQNKEKLFLLPRIMVDGRFTLNNLVARISF